MALFGDENMNFDTLNGIKFNKTYKVL